MSSGIGLAVCRWIFGTIMKCSTEVNSAAHIKTDTYDVYVYPILSLVRVRMQDVMVYHYINCLFSPFASTPRS